MPREIAIRHTFLLRQTGRMIRIVVGAALLHEGRVLAAQRARPAPVAGRWELPGGKVEPGEGDVDAVRREWAEELGCAVDVTGWLDGEEEVGPGLTLRVATARLVSGSPEPHEHRALRWLSADELAEVDWLASDRPFVAQLPALLGRP